MLILAKSILAMMIGFILSILFGIVLIPFLNRKKAKQSVSIFLEKKHKKKNGIPTMGGLIFIIPTIMTILLLLACNKLDFSMNLFLILFVFIAYALIGFVDDYLIIKRHNNIGLTEFQKLALQIVIALIFYFIYMKSGHSSTIDIHTLNIHFNLGWFYILFILFMLVGNSNAVNITDGLDGLAGGLSAIAFLALALMTWGSNWLPGNGDIAIFCFILVGSLLGFLFFNANPAKIIMGDTGSLSLGATMATVAILTNHELTFVVIAGVFIVETLVCIIQMIAGRYWGKRIFLMAPLHHHFEKLGYDEKDIVKSFWVVGLILSMMAIIFSVWI